MKRVSHTDIKKTGVIISVFLLLIFSGLCNVSTAQAAKNKSSNGKSKMDKELPNTFASPDFAFPETVEINAENELKSALDKGDDVKALRAAMQISIARDLVLDENYVKGITLFDELAHKLKAPYSQLASLLKAQIYLSIYQSSPWTFNDRAIPLTPVPSNVMEWSKDIFANTLTDIIEETFADVEIARETPISSITDILENTEDAVKIGMTVYDFMTLKAGELLGNFSDNNADAIIPFGDVMPTGNKKTVRNVGLLLKDILRTNITWHESRGEMRLASAMSYFWSNNMPWQERNDFVADCVKKYIDTPYCGAFILSQADFLEETDMDEADGESARSSLEKSNLALKKRYALIADYLKRFPGCDNAKALENRLTVLGEEKISASLPQRLYPGESGKIKVSASNVFDFNILAVKLPDSYITKDIRLEAVRSVGKVSGVVPVKFSGDKPVKFEEEFELSPLSAGVYVLVPSANGTLAGLITGTAPRQSLTTFTVSRLASFKTSDEVSNDGNRLYVVNGKDQSPVAGAKVTLTPSYNTGSQKQKIDKITDKAGEIAVPDGSYSILVSKGADRLAGDIWNGRYGNRNENRQILCRVLTDLSIYHPGDSVGFVGMIYEQKGRELNWLPAAKVNVKLIDANWQPVDTISLTSDRFGRVSGKFAIPLTGLLGRYTIELSNEGKNNSTFGSGSFQVADYKSPTFYVISEGVEGSYKIGDVVKIKGKAMTYSGMPVANALVKFDVKYLPWRWLSSYVNASYGGEATTNADGSFVIELPTEGLRGTRYAFGGYQLNISVTGPSGETQQAPSVSFSLGEAYTIIERLPEKICADEGARDYAVTVSDIVGAPVQKTVYYRISRYGNDADVISSGKFESPVFRLDPDLLPSGRYKIRFSLTEGNMPADNEQPVFSVLTIYRNSDKVPPYVMSVWTPEDKIIADKDLKTVKVKVGSSYPDSWVFMQVADCDRVIEQRWLRINEGMVEVSVPVPAADNSVKVTFSGMHDFKQEMTGVTIIPKVRTEEVKIKAESFRDRIAPGARESWKFSFTLGDGALAGIPVSAVMSNKALNAIEPFQWIFNPAGNIGYNLRGNIQWVYYGRGGGWTIPISKVRYGGMDRVTYPAWDLYGLAFYGGERMMNRAMMRKMSVRGGAQVVEQLSSVTYTSASIKNEMKESAVEEEAMDAVYLEEPAVTGGMMDSNGIADDGGSQPRRESVLRQVECPLAFFMPELVTDDQGNALVDFTVPEFNGTWQFQIMGYTSDMKGGVSVLNSVASKPVMTQMNAPRFLRTGDKATIAAMIYNNSTERLMLSGKIEVFDVVSGQILASYNSTENGVEPGGADKIAVNYEVTDKFNYIGIRVYGYGGDFSDGEQTVVPVYPSSTPVIESTPFYIAPGQDEFSMKLPSFGKDAKVTLQYCDNPIWEVVTALPDVSEPKSANVLSQVYSLYGNAIGAGLAKDYPEIVEAIKIFSDPDNSVDSTLVSNLEKNQDLKNVVLNNTPWVRSAASETLRMQSLVKYGDVRRSEEIITSTLKEIGKLQNADGGWSWCAGMPSSDYITARVLLHLGMLRSMGYLPADAVAMAKKAVTYSDAAWVKMLKEYKGDKFPYLSMMNYLYVRSSFKDVTESASFGSMADKGLNAAKSEWKGLGIYEKAVAAILLNRSGYNMEARTILESLRQYASVKEDKGMWFDNLPSSFGGWNKLITTAQVLEAYAEIEPGSVNIDKLRQWLLITKQAENWGDDRETSEVIHAILTSGSKWTVPSAPAEIIIDGENVKVDRLGTLTGNLSVSVNVSGKGNMRIKRTGAGPAWGGLISQYVAPIVQVKSEGLPELSIEKKIYAITNNADGTAAADGDLKVGDKVRVTLTVVADRDLEYVAIMDARSACLEPADQISGYTASDGVWMYKEVRDDSTNLFIPFLPKGTHVISYECYADRPGSYTLGIASAQSQYAPTIAAHSAGTVINVTE